jgi:hypothetical protein
MDQTRRLTIKPDLFSSLAWNKRAIFRLGFSITFSELYKNGPIDWMGEITRGLTAKTTQTCTLQMDVFFKLFFIFLQMDLRELFLNLDTGEGCQ